MELGVTDFKLGDGWFAKAIGARLARVTVSIAEPEDLGKFRDTCGEAWESGCKILLNPVGDKAMLHEIVSEFSVSDAWVQLLDRYCDRTMQLLLRVPREQFAGIEVWGMSRFPIVVGGNGPELDYASILRHVSTRLREEWKLSLPIWLGGYGLDMEQSFLQFGLSQHAPLAFDVCNLNPIPLPCDSVEATLEKFEYRMEYARKTLDSVCGKQPFAASRFGVPVWPLDDPPPEEYSNRWQFRGGILAVFPHEAVKWYARILRLFEANDFQYVCLMARDTGIGNAWADHCGLFRYDGQKKSFTDALLVWLQEEWPLQLAEDDLMATEAIVT